jgi:hypothetical protein
MSNDQENSGLLALMALGAAATTAYFLGRRNKPKDALEREAQAYRELNRASQNPMLYFDKNNSQKDFENLEIVYQAERLRQIESSHGELYKYDPSLQKMDRALVELESSGGTSSLERLHEAVQNFSQIATEGLGNMPNSSQFSSPRKASFNTQNHHQGRQYTCTHCNGRREFLCPTCRGRTQEYGLQSSSGINAIDNLLNLKNQIDCTCKTCNGRGLVVCSYCLTRQTNPRDSGE